MVKRNKAHAIVLIAIILAGIVTGCGSNKKEGAQAPKAAVSPGGNLQSTIQGFDTNGPKPVVTFTLFDEKGEPIDPSTPGMSVRFTLARIGADGNYRNYIKSSTAGQPGLDSGGTFAATDQDGTYTYTFGTDIKDTTKTLGGLAFDSSLTHTVGAQIQRTVVSAAGTPFQQAVNPYLNFRPDGKAVTVSREIVSISACNGCHGKLGLHGGGRREIALCILCHNPGPTDLETDQAIDMKSLIHKIHMGEKLPSNAAGGDYTIIGFGGAVHSYKTVAFPFMSGDTTITATPIECIKCHVSGTDLSGNSYGKDADKWKESPTREKCSTCHDLTTYDDSVTKVVKNGKDNITATAVPHTGGVQTGDSLCAGCHPDTGGNDYDITPKDAEEPRVPVPSAHTILERSTVYSGINFAIISVIDATAGSAPTVTFKVTDDEGNIISPASPSSFSLKVGYFSQTDYINNGMVEYGQPLTQALTGATANGDGSYTITFASPIPATATGVGVIGIEGRRPYSVSTPHKGTQNYNVGGKAVQYYFDLATGLKITDPSKQRRQAVDTNKCLVCHSRLSLHGANRVNNVMECVICHNPNATDRSRRPATPVDGLTERPIDFKVMIHSIHTGENLDLSKPYVIYGFGNSVNDFSEVRFPRDRRDCLACHIDAEPVTYGVPLTANILGTTSNTGTDLNNKVSDDNSRTLPHKSVCVSCHNNAIASGHADGKVVNGVETCSQCHSTGLLLGPDFAHLPAR
ncbi:MAG: OmcA/MtrC family decaheme c-type cytochrome [Nitrospirae bacterium]|nr:OmcA/MtrC family decaheme c-type cytochrome [Nitrospirota bacterium]